MTTAVIIATAIFSLLAMIGAAVALTHNKTVTRELQESKKRELELVQTLTQILDEDGNVLGQLMLPGQTATSEAIKKLEGARWEMIVAHEEIVALRADLKKSRVQEEKISTTLAEVVDKDGSVLAQIRLPGKRVSPNRTPCGGSCIHAFWKANDWHCIADQGRQADYARPKFLDQNDQCIMYALHTAP